MLGLLASILCWIKQIGAMVLNALIDVVNLVIAGIAAFVQGLLDAWPVDMPDDLPEAPSLLLEAIGWVKWTPLPVEAGMAFLAFAVTVWLAWLAIAIVLRWAKVID